MSPVAAAWDQRSLSEQRRAQNTLLRQTLLQMTLGHVPYVRSRLEKLGIDARAFKGLDELHRIPLTMRQDILDLVRNPDGARAVLLQGSADGVKRFSNRAVLRRVALARLLGGEEMQEMALEAATRPIHIHLADGPLGSIPVGYTRDDLDLLARAGARLGGLLGLERTDRLLNLVPAGPSVDHWGIFYMAHGIGMTAVHDPAGDLRSALTVFEDGRPTAIAVASTDALAFPGKALGEGVDLSALRVLIAVGRSLSAVERTTLGEALIDAGATEVRISAAYGPAEGRMLWGECAVPAGKPETFGFHTFPDLELVEIVSPETGERLGDHTPGEIVITPLGFRGGGVPRWRTGDLATGGMTTQPCPNCGRTVPRVGPTVRRAAWFMHVSLNGSPTSFDLRAAGAAAAQRARDWQLELVAKDGSYDLYVYLHTTPEPAPVIELWEELRRLGAQPTQIIVDDPDSLALRRSLAPGPWPRFWQHRPS
jgi:phenylacetate-coenzyme A ligase PaaK-like adenylate-forming protein